MRGKSSTSNHNHNQKCWPWLQGHGRDVGQLAAHTSQEFMQSWLTNNWGD
ncbi:unnamed protein product, partial [Discosporangium mesarthrocarpum]